MQLSQLNVGITNKQIVFPSRARISIIKFRVVDFGRKPLECAVVQGGLISPFGFLAGGGGGAVERERDGDGTHTLVRRINS